MLNFILQDFISSNSLSLVFSISDFHGEHPSQIHPESMYCRWKTSDPNDLLRDFEMIIGFKVLMILGLFWLSSYMCIAIFQMYACPIEQPKKDTPITYMYVGWFRTSWYPSYCYNSVKLMSNFTIKSYMIFPRYNISKVIPGSAHNRNKLGGKQCSLSSLPCSSYATKSSWPWWVC